MTVLDCLKDCRRLCKIEVDRGFFFSLRASFIFISFVFFLSLTSRS